MKKIGIGIGQKKDLSAELCTWVLTSKPDMKCYVQWMIRDGHFMLVEYSIIGEQLAEYRILFRFFPTMRCTLHLRTTDQLWC